MIISQAPGVGDDGVSQRQTSSGRFCCKYYEEPQFADLWPSIAGKCLTHYDLA